VQRNVVGLGEEVVERHQFDAQAGRDRLGHERVVCDQAHAEAGGAPRHFLTDAAEAGEAKRLVAHFLAEKFLLFPLALFHGRVGRGQMAGEREDETHRELGHADAVGARCVHHDDAAAARSRHVDVVDASAGPGDYPKLGRCRDDGRRHLGGAANHECVGVSDVGGQRVRCAAGARVHRPSFGAEQFESGSGEVVGDDDLGRSHVGRRGRYGVVHTASIIGGCLSVRWADHRTLLRGAA
jgi:hypothetical protein